MITLKVDAARQVNGNSAAGAVVIINNQQTQLKAPLNATGDNHEAEFDALIWALQHLPVSDESMLQIYTDSKILNDALHKHYAKHYQDKVDVIDDLLVQFSLVLIDWVPEKDNLGAHNLALQALK